MPYHPALRKHQLMVTFGWTDKDLEDVDAKTLLYEGIINRGMSIKQKLQQKMGDRGIR